MTAPPAPAVLILMATRNGARWLPGQLDSIAAQEMGDWALVASDDGSTDATRAILADFAARHPGRVRVVDGPGQGAAANFLTALCRDDLPLGPGTHVALSDQDDIWLPHKLSRALAVLADAAEGARPLVYGGQSLHIDESGRPCGRSRRPKGAVGLGNALVQNMVSGHSLMLNPAAVALARAAGVPRGVAFHDWWLGLLVLACGGRAVIDGDTVLHYRQHGQNVMGAPAGALAQLRRLGLLFGRDYARWIGANLAALQTFPAGKIPDLTPEARATVAALARAPAAGPGRVAAFRRLGLHRQGHVGTLLLHLAALIGRA